MATQNITSDKLVRDFIQEHNLVTNQFVKNEAIGMYWTRRTNISINQALSTKSIELNSSLELTWGILLNMLDRIFEYTEGAIAAFAAGAPASSEVISRTAVEASVNLQYILRKDQTERLSQYFYSYLKKEQKEIRDWIKSIESLPPKEATIHRDAALKKKSVIDHLKNFLDQSGLPIINSPYWPNVAERFRDLGLQTSYRTVYAALSSQTHSDAEDTLNYFLVKSIDDQELSIVQGYFCNFGQSHDCGFACD